MTVDEVGYVRVNHATGPVYRGTLLFVDHGLVWIQDPQEQTTDTNGAATWTALGFTELAIPLHRVWHTWTKSEPQA